MITDIDILKRYGESIDKLCMAIHTPGLDFIQKVADRANKYAAITGEEYHAVDAAMVDTILCVVSK